MLSWHNANLFCQHLITLADQAVGVTTHLLSIDSMTESIVVNLFLKTTHASYWTDGQASSSYPYSKKWSWNARAYVNYGYLKDSFRGLQNVYMKPNSSNDYELYDAASNSTFAYICEAQGEKKRIQIVQIHFKSINKSFFF